MEMNEIKKFESIIGGRWTGIIFHRENEDRDNQAKHPMKFCEAVKESSTGPVVLTQKIVNCPGALRSFGWNMEGDDRLAKKKCWENIGIKEQVARSIIKEVPHFNGNISAITVGSYESPDVMMSYAQPEAVMRFINQWQKVSGKVLDVSISSVMAVCGCVAAGTHISGKITLSFGCPESRSFGGISNDRLIIGVPAQLAENFFNTNG
jgi:uncharacterized protein (DUF169 family)